MAQTQHQALPNPRGARLREKYFKVIADHDQAMRENTSLRSRVSILEVETQRLKESSDIKDKDNTKTIKALNAEVAASEARIEWLLKRLGVTDKSGQFKFQDGAIYTVPVPKGQ